MFLLIGESNMTTAFYPPDRNVSTFQMPTVNSLNESNIQKTYKSFLPPVDVFAPSQEKVHPQLAKELKLEQLEKDYKDGKISKIKYFILKSFLQATTPCYSKECKNPVNNYAQKTVHCCSGGSPA